MKTKLEISAAHKKAREGDLEGAIRIARQLVKKDPANPVPNRALTSFLRQKGDRAALRTALDAWAGNGSLSGRIEALDMLRRELGMTTRLRDRAQRVLIDARRRGLRKQLEGTRTPVSDRIIYRLYKGDLEAARALIQALPENKRHNEIKMVLPELQAQLQAAGAGDRLRDIYGDEVRPLASRPKILLSLASDMIRAGRKAEVPALLDLLRDDPDHQAAIAAIRVNMAEASGDATEIDAAQADWRAAVIRTGTARERADYVLATGDAALARDLADQADWKGITPDTARDLIDLFNARDDSDTAFALSVAALERWPDRPKLIERANLLANTHAEGAQADYHRKRELLMRELGPDLVARIGDAALEDAGGRNRVHALIRAAVADPADAAGLLDFARLCFSSLRIIATPRKGERREATALHPHGAAHWAAQRAECDRLAGLIRALVASAATVTPDDPEIFRLLLDLQALLLEDTPAAVATADALMALLHPGQDEPRSQMLGRVALSCSDAALHDRIADWQGDDLRILRYRDLRTDTAVLRHDAATDHHDISVFGPRYQGRITLGFPHEALHVTAPGPAWLRAGFLAGQEPDTALNLTGGRLTVRPEGRMIFSGTHAVALTPSAQDPLHQAQPVLVVPAGRMHFRNYYHFTGQWLPRLLGVLEQVDGQPGPRRRIAIPHFAAGFVDEMLRIAGVDADRILRVPDEDVLFDDAVLCSPVLEDTQCSAAELAVARRTLHLPQDGPATRKLFLQRSIGTAQQIGRSLTNAQELAELALDAGFEIIDPGTMDQDAQRAAFSQASVICGATGAALANMMYLPDGAHAICLSPQETCRTFFPGLAMGQKLEFTWVLGPFDPELVNSQRYPHRPFAIDPAHLRMAFDAV